MKKLLFAVALFLGVSSFANAHPPYGRGYYRGPGPAYGYGYRYSPRASVGVYVNPYSGYGNVYRNPYLYGYKPYLYPYNAYPGPQFNVGVPYTYQFYPY